MQQTVGLLAAVAFFPLVLFAAVMTPRWLVPLWVVAAVTAMYVIHDRARQLRGVATMRRVLKVYDWSPALAHSVSRSVCRFEGHSPDDPAASVSVELRAPFGGRFLHWARWCRANDGQEVRFCGDPRFLGVVAHSDLSKGWMRLVAQREAIDPRMSARRKGVSEAAKERARAVGARVG
ncbi:hypothetical protein [Streptomyces sp. NPDC017993]|uniref:hypothetical protein n=1 Tax=Streptomyces sp. NPDC017993 TaxID=3365027 RepID=UPI0037AAEF6D